MSQATILKFGSDQKFRNLAFPDLEARLEQHLDRIKSLADLERLLNAIKPLFQDKRYSEEELLRLKKLRQRAYDRKRNHKIPAYRSAMSSQRLKSEQVITSGALKEPSKSASDAASKNEIPKISYERLIEMAPRLIICLSAASIVSFFLWHQSLDLYISASFTNATYASFGGILMIVGFAAYHSITRSWLALILCLYAGAYESYLMVSGTINDDNQAHINTMQHDPELIFLQEKWFGSCWWFCD